MSAFAASAWTSRCLMVTKDSFVGETSVLVKADSSISSTGVLGIVAVSSVAGDVQDESSSKDDSNAGESFAFVIAASWSGVMCRVTGAM